MTGAPREPAHPSGAGILARVEAQVAARPRAGAVEGADGASLDYLSLWSRAAAIAGHLAGQGVGPGDRVAVRLPPGPDHAAALLGAWWQGASVVPVDAAWPAARVEAVLARARPAAILGPAPPPAAAPPGPPHRPRPGDEAWLIFTSGSAGRPKGVRVAHDGVPALLDAQRAAFEVGPGDRALFALGVAFDASLSDLLTTLTAGATLVYAPPGLLADPDALAGFLAERSITHADLPPALLARVKQARLPATLRVVVVGGEASAPATLRAWARDRRVVHVYGPTEATICASLSVVDPSTWDRPSIGHPVPGLTFEVDAAGELHLGGPAVALGYLDPTPAEASRFSLRGGERWYRTGDHVVAEPDGTYTFVGRRDRMIKLGGRLVQPGEVEAALRACPGVARAVVTPWGNPPTTLRAQVVAAPGVALRPNILRAALARTLPPWMLPAAIDLADALPEGAHGKVDAQAVDRVARVAALFAAALGRPVGAFEPLDDLGRTSLVALEVVARAEASGLALCPGAVSGAPHAAAVAAAPLADGAVEDLRAAALAPIDWPAPSGGAGDALLLTGATGFLGGALLRALRARTDRPIVCLVRARDAAHAAARLGPDLPPGVTALPGDLTAPDLGLGAAWSRWAAAVGAVIHGGAVVDMVRGEAALRATNLDGTRHVLRFCAAGAPKHLHLISTLSVFVAGNLADGVLREDADPAAAARVHGGYARTKWAAEVAARLAGDRFPLAIHRVGLVTGDARTGHGGPRDQLTLALRGLAALGCAPATPPALRVDLTPVDVVATAIAHLVVAEARGPFHLAHPTGAHAHQLFDALRAVGVELPVVDPAAWRARAPAGVERAAAWLGLRRALGDPAPHLRGADLFLSTGVTFDRRRADAALAASGVAWPADVDGLLRRYAQVALEGR
ncbi:MAG: AMP-binding protein [Myxococcales bacterium]|nr:AMP-binding protein [Myxococcales bacterium]